MTNVEVSLKKHLERIAGETKLLTYDVELKKTRGDGANVLAALYEGTISSPNKTDVKLFAKVATPALRDHVPVELMYETEINVYTKLRTAYEELQKKYQIAEQMSFKFVKYYTSCLEFNSEFILLENLATKGFSVYDRIKPVNWDYASRAAEELAKFHALSIAFKNEYPEVYSVVTREEDHEKFLDQMYDLTNASFKLKSSSSCAERIPEELELRFEKFIKVQLEKDTFFKYYGPSKLGFIIHGDYMTSNIMFRRQGGKITQLIPVDYQAIRRGSPTIDLLHFIYCGTDAQFRKRHLQQLLEHYYDTLALFLQKLNLNPQEIFTREEFYKDYKERHNFGLYTAILQLPEILAGSDVDGNVESKKMFEERFLDIFNEYVNLGAL